MTLVRYRDASEVQHEPARHGPHEADAFARIPPRAPTGWLAPASPSRRRPMLMIAAVNVVAGATSEEQRSRARSRSRPLPGWSGPSGTWKQGTTVTINGSDGHRTPRSAGARRSVRPGGPAERPVLRDRARSRSGPPMRPASFSGSARPCSLPRHPSSRTFRRLRQSGGDLRASVPPTAQTSPTRVSRVNLKFAPIRPTVIPGTATVVEGDSGTTIVTVPDHPHGAARQTPSWWSARRCSFPARSCREPLRGTDYTDHERAMSPSPAVETRNDPEHRRDRRHGRRTRTSTSRVAFHRSHQGRVVGEASTGWASPSSRKL